MLAPSHASTKVLLPPYTVQSSRKLSYAYPILGPALLPLKLRNLINASYITPSHADAT